MIERILLLDIDYDIEDGEESKLHARWSHHPLGLMYLASAVKEKLPDTQFKIFHTTTSPHSTQDITDILDDFKPDLVGFRSLSLYQSQFKKFTTLVRDKAPEALLIGGGPYSSVSYREILKGGYVDLIVYGEGEDTFTELVAWLNEHAELPTDMAGTVVGIGGEVRKNPPRPLIPNLDTIAWPDLDLINLDDYEGISNHAFQSASESAFIESSRGCPYRCFYCHIAREKTTRNRSPENVADEMEAIYQSKGIKDFVFVDDIFNVPKKTGKETLRLIAKRLPGVRINFPNGLRADQLDLEFLDLLEEVGTVHLALAVESASPRLQKLMGKHLRLDLAKEMIHEASKRFITCGFFMVGFPSETREEAQATIGFAKDMLHMAQPILSVVRVFPGTVLYSHLDPTPEEAMRVERQTAQSCYTGLKKDIDYYGDIFPKEKVPLRTEDIREFRWEWIRDVMMNKERVRNSYQVMKKFFTEEQIVEFNKNLFDNENFNIDLLYSYMGEKPPRKKKVA